MTTLSDLDLLALTLWGEARGEPVEGLCAVANVIRNRVRRGAWGTTYAAVVRAPQQFSCWDRAGGVKNFTQLQTLTDAVQHGDVPDDPVLRTCYWIAEGALRGVLPDNTGGSCHYHATIIPIFPRWARGVPAQAIIGAHTFYAGIA